MKRIIVRAAAICGALPVSGADVYINGELRGRTGERGYSKPISAEGDTCTVTVSSEGYMDCISSPIKLYEGTTVVWTGMLCEIKVK